MAAPELTSRLGEAARQQWVRSGDCIPCELLATAGQGAQRAGRGAGGGCPCPCCRLSTQATARVALQ